MTKQAKRKCWILALDALAIPGMILCERLSDLMLSTQTTCTWLRFGGKCVTCGGTHFVNSILNGRFGEAIGHNSFLFFLTVFFAVSFILLNFYWLFDWSFAKKVLSRVYRIPTLVVIIVIMLAFLFVRNIPVVIRCYEIIASYF